MPWAPLVPEWQNAHHHGSVRVPVSEDTDSVACARAQRETDGAMRAGFAHIVSQSTPYPLIYYSTDVISHLLALLAWCACTVDFLGQAGNNVLSLSYGQREGTSGLSARTRPGPTCPLDRNTLFRGRLAEPPMRRCSLPYRQPGIWSN